jgi:hypothetical protein
MSANLTRGDVWDDLLTTTLENVRGSLADQIWNARPLHAWLFKKGRRRMVDGGTEIVEPLVYAGGHTGWYGENDTLEIKPISGISAASFPWVSHYGSVYITGREKLMNNGKEQIINLLDAKVMQTKETMNDDLSVAAFKDEPDSGEEMFGLGYLIDDHVGDAAKGGGSGVLVGNINSDDNAWWRSVVLDGAATTGDFGSDGLNTGEKVRKAVRTGRNAASDGGSDRCDAAFTDLATYEAIEDSYVQKVQYEDVDSANAGFENIEVSKMPLFWDFHCPEGTVFGINSKYLQVVGHSSRFMAQTPFTKNPTDTTAAGTAAGGSVSGVKDGQYSLITSLLQMTTRNRRRHFRINNITID